MKTSPSLRDARLRAGYGLRELARKLQVSPQYLLDIERGYREGNPGLRARYNAAVRKPNAR